MSEYTTTKFIKRANNVHKNRYDYTKCNYTKGTIKVIIRCKVHGIFLQTPSNHLQGTGCPKCGTTAKTTEYFVAKAALVHGSRYDYSAVDYSTTMTPVKITCNTHGPFFQRPKIHLQGYGCPKCKFSKIAALKRHTTKQFIDHAIQQHGYTYDYSKSTYVNNHTPIEIICKKHGAFWQSPYSHVYQNHNCPQCSWKMSRGERAINNVLEKYSIEFVREKTFTDLRGISNHPSSRLRFDFWIPTQNVLIEYDGPQHYRLTNIKGRQSITQQKKNLIRLRENDQIKNHYAAAHNIQLIRIPYYEDVNSLTSCLEDTHLREVIAKALEHQPRQCMG